jgi:hypothetical protein
MFTLNNKEHYSEKKLKHYLNQQNIRLLIKYMSSSFSLLRYGTVFAVVPVLLLVTVKFVNILSSPLNALLVLPFAMEQSYFARGSILA